MAETTLEAYVRTVADYFQTTAPNNGPISYRLLKEHGRSFPIRKNRLNGKGKSQQCYQNSYHMMVDRGYTYCEGFATSHLLGVAIEHAWVLDEEGYVVDPTWSDGTEYFGVAFHSLGVRTVALQTRVYGIMSSTYMMGRSPEDCYKLLVGCIDGKFELPEEIR